MSSSSSSPPNFNELTDDYQFDHVLGQLMQQWSHREQVTETLREAIAVFAPQSTEPDGYTFLTTCEKLLNFLHTRVPLEYAEQNLVVQVLQIALGMHENVINDSELSPSQRSSHQLATSSLASLCEFALESSVTSPDLLRKVRLISRRVERAHANAKEALDLSKYLDFDDMTYDQVFASVENPTQTSSGDTSETPPPLPESSKPTKQGSVQVTTAADPRQRPVRIREKALAILNDTPYTSKGRSLGRRHTMPAVLPTTSGSRSSCSRDHGLHALKEED